jgi:energy-coupling factor transporter ATP-binding protein EcfA2
MAKFGSFFSTTVSCHLRYTDEYRNPPFPLTSDFSAQEIHPSLVPAGTLICDAGRVTETLPEDDEPRTGSPLLSGFSVKRLYGRYSHDVKFPLAGQGEPGNLALLRGDNGCGKTSLLRLLWHALSPPTIRHRVELARTPFSSFSITISDHSQIVVRKQDGLVGSFDFIIERPTGPVLSYQFEVDEKGTAVEGSTLSEVMIRRSANVSRNRAIGNPRIAEIAQFIEELQVHPLFLADDRRLYVDDAEIDRLRAMYVANDRDRESSGRTPGANDVVADELRIALRRVNDWLRTLALRGQNTGSAGANSIYHDVLQKLAATGQGPAQADTQEGKTASAARLLADLKVRSPRFERYDLVPHFDAIDFERLLGQVEDGQPKQLALDIVIPYLNSLTARCDALEEAEQRVTTVLEAANEFFIDKELAFSARTRESLRIITDEGEQLDPRQLSSGERQLMMLVCATLLAGRDSRLFLIDEPELSLGITWQRRILDSLLALTSGSSLQFVVATHSIEVLSAQVDSLVSLSR